MTKKEMSKILAIMTTTYPNFKLPNMEFAVDVWADMMSEYTYQEVSLALKSYITSDSSGFAPSIGQLINLIQMMKTQESLSEMEAWGLVSRAIRNGYYGAEKEFERLPELVQKAVGSPTMIRNWSQTDYESIETVVQSNFMRTYRAIVARESHIRKMPTEVKQIIESVNSDIYKLHANDTAVAIEQKEDYTDCVPMPEKVKERMKKIFG